MFDGLASVVIDWKWWSRVNRVDFVVSALRPLAPDNDRTADIVGGLKSAQSGSMVKIDALSLKGLFAGVL